VFALPEIGRSAHLVAQVGQELGFILDLLPDLGQEGRPPHAVPQDDAVHAGPELGQQVLTAGVLQPHGDGQARDLNVNAGKVGFGHRPEAVVLQGGSHGMLAHVLRQALVGLERADAATQFPLDGQRDEGGPRLKQRRG
jgi:hypothetical protein